MIARLNEVLNMKRYLFSHGGTVGRGKEIKLSEVRRILLNI